HLVVGLKHTKFNGRRWYLDDYELKTLIDNEQTHTNMVIMQSTQSSLSTMV
ncbi:hypothetical protein Q099_02799, partial [Staphylococcus aureus M1020]